MQAAILGLTGVVLGAAKSVFARMAYEFQADPITVLYLRMLICLPFLLVIGFFYERRHPKHGSIKWNDIFAVIALSFLGYYISSVFDFVGLVYVEASIERLIIFMYPTMVIILSAIYLKKKVQTRQIIAIMVAYVGILMAFGDKLMVKNTPEFWLGSVYIFISALTYAIFITASEKLISRLGSVRFTTIATLTMTICIIAHALFAGKTNLNGLESRVIWSCTLMALLSTIAPIYMFNYAMARLGATNMSIISCLGPVFTLALSAGMLSEKVTGWQIAGTFVVMSGVFIISADKINLNRENLAVRFSKPLRFKSFVIKTLGMQK